MLCVVGFLVFSRRGRAPGTGAGVGDVAQFVDSYRRAVVSPFTGVSEKEDLFKAMYDAPTSVLWDINVKYWELYNETLRESINEEWVWNLNPFDMSWKDKLLQRMNDIGI